MKLEPSEAKRIITDIAFDDSKKNMHFFKKRFVWRKECCTNS